MGSYVNRIKIGDTTHLIEPTLYGTCSTAAATAAKTVTLEGFELQSGVTVAVKFTVTNTAASPTLSINSSDAKAIYYHGSAIAKELLVANKIYYFVYDGSHWEIIGDLDTDTDTKVTQTAVGNTYTYWRPLLFGASNSSSEGFSPSTVTSSVYATAALSVQPSTGTIRASIFKGSGESLTSLNASNISSGTLSADRLATSGATAGSYGPSAAISGTDGTTMNVPYITVDNKGRITGIENKVYTSVNTWRPIGTGATDAAAGNHNHNSNYVQLLSSSTDNAIVRFDGTDGQIQDSTAFVNDKGVIKTSGTYVHNTSMQNQTGYVKFLTLVASASYINRGFEISYSNRGRNVGSIYCIFSNISGTDPTLTVTKTGVVPIYYIKSATSTWDLYFDKTENHDQCTFTIINPGQLLYSGLTSTWTDIHVTELPEGYLTATTHNLNMNITGNATTATALATGRTLQVALGSTSASTAFDGSANISNIGVSGTLAIAQGGTGKTTASEAWTALGGGDSGTHSDNYYALASHGTHVTTATVQTALGISSGGSATKWLNEQGNWTTPSFTDKYHKTGSWNGLTYTALAVNSAEALTFTIPTGTSSTTVALGDHNHDTIYIKRSAELLTTNPFSPTSLTGPYISKIDNGLYAANKRWTVTGTNISSAWSLFDGNYESQAVVNAGQTGVVLIDFDPNHNNSAYFPGYPYGYILVSFYYTSGPESVSGRVYCNYNAHGIGWHNITFSPISDNTSSQITYRSAHQGYYNISQLEISIVAGSEQAKATQIEIHLDRPNSAYTPFLSKYQAETLYYDLTAPKFIGNLQGNADTATSANITSTKYGVAYYSNTTGTFASLGVGTSGQFLKTNGSGSAPAWTTIDKSTVGLGNVENTALSTWTGSSNITTIGTLSSGTVPWARLSNTPTTLAGYGITDAADSSHNHNSTYLKLDGSNNMTSDINIIAGDTNKFINFWYNTNKTAGASWRTGMYGTGTNDANYYVIESGTSTSSATTWNRVVQIGQNTYDAGFAGNIYPITNNSKTLGTSNNKWSNVYATTFTGDLSGNATSATTATNLANNPSIQTSGTTQITITAGGKTSSAYTVPFATSATTATYIKCPDTRSTELNPTDLNAAQGVRFDFKAKGTINLTATDAYAGVMSFRPYASNSDWSGGNAHQLAFNSQGLHWRTGGASWGDWYQILDSNNTTAPSSVPTLSWNTESTVFTLNGSAVKIKAMAKPTYTYSDVGAAASSHNHNASDINAGTLAIARIADGSITNAKLENSKITIAGTDVSLGGSISLETMGLSNALHFIGITSTTLTNGSTTSTLTEKSTNSLSKTTGFVDGDVVMDGDQLREYVWSGSAWRLLGITTSSAYTQPATTATNTWIAQISQGTDGKITATTGTLDTSGTWSGNAVTATTASSVSRATFGDRNNGEHNASNIDSNGLWYYSSNGPASTLGAQSTDGALYSQAYSTFWVGQIAQDYRDGQLFVRSKNNNSWQNWYAIPKFTTSTGGVGESTTPVYVDTNGNLVACTAYSNASVNYATSAGSATSATTATSLTDFVISKYTIPVSKGVRIKYKTNSSPVLISSQLTVGGGRLILIGGGYGQEVVRSDFTEVVSCNSSNMTWSVPNTTGYDKVVEIMNLNPSNTASITVWAASACEFEEISALTTTATNRKLLHSSNYTDYTVTKTGTGASGTWGISITGSAGSVAWANTGHPDTFPPIIGTTSTTAMAGNTNVNNVTHTKRTDAANNKYYVTGTTSSATNTGGDIFDTGVYVTTVDGGLSAVRQYWNYSDVDKAYSYFNNTTQSIDFVFI